MDNGKLLDAGSQERNGTPEIRVSEIFQILLRRKFTLLFSMLLMLMLAFLYIFLAEPVYESAVLIKKEKPLDERSRDDFAKIVQIQSPDEIETEIEILKTRPVLEKVVAELGLNIIVDKVILPGGDSRKYEIPLLEYQQRAAAELADPAVPPIQISSLQTAEDLKERILRIRVSENSLLEVYEGKSNSLLKTALNTPATQIQLADLRCAVDFTRAPPGAEYFLRIVNPGAVANQLGKDISVQSLRKTSLFRIAYQSASPQMAQRIANTVAEKFRETRLEHKQQTIRYSFNFVDQQLEEVSQKLKESEAALSAFKEQNQILEIDATSTNAAEFLSTLEAEKIKTDLELTEYLSRYEALKKELQSKGYFDQTYLTPLQTDGENTPFSTLLRQLSDAELERLALLEKRTDDHPDVQALNRRIAEIETNLANFNQNTIASYDIIIRSLQKKQADLQGLIWRYTRKVKDFPRQENILTDLTRQKKTYEKMFVLLLDKREEMRMSELSKLQDIVIVEPAALPLAPVKPRKLFTLAAALFVGAMVGLSQVFILEFYGKKVRQLDEIEDRLQLPILAILPKYPKLLGKKIAGSFTIDNHIGLLANNQLGYKESYLVMRAKLPQLLQDRNIILFTSCEQNTGKTTVATNFSICLALSGKRILLIECDRRKSKLRKFFRLPSGAPGLVDFLIKEDAAAAPIYKPLKEFGIPHATLDVIPAGGHHHDSVELFDSTKFRNFLEMISSYYDYVFIDTPPLTCTADVFVLGGFIKDAILVVRPEVTFKESLAWAVRSMRQFGMNILGSVINGVEIQNLSDRYRYSYGYSYAYTEEGPKSLPSHRPGGEKFGDSLKKKDHK